MTSWTEKSWYLLPAGLLIAASFCFSLVELLPGLRHIAPWLSFAVLFYWLAYCPQCLPSWLLFLVGIVQDGLYGAPLGVSSALYLSLQGILLLYRPLLVREGFLAMCIIFAIISLLWGGFRLCLTSFVVQDWLPFQPIVWQWLLTCLIYPPLHLGFSRLYYLSPFSRTHAS